MRRAARRDAQQLEAAYVSYLAKMTDRTPEGTVDVDLAQRLVRTGCDPDVAREAHGCLHALIGRRYGGQSVPFEDAATRVRGVLERLEQARCA